MTQRYSAIRRFGLSFMLAISVFAAQARAEHAEHGLMWHRTGLPAVFPLLVRTKAGQDYFLTLRDPATGEGALAAYIEGGRQFRVLVPPGTYEVQFAFGLEWQGERDLFGPGALTQRVTMASPLTFELKNFNTKGGHLIDLTDVRTGQEARIEVRPQRLCQRFHLIHDAARPVFKPVVGQGTLPDVLEFYATPLDRLGAELELDLILPEAREEEDQKRSELRMVGRMRVCE